MLFSTTGRVQTPSDDRCVHGKVSFCKATPPCFRQDRLGISFYWGRALLRVIYAACMHTEILCTCRACAIDQSTSFNQPKYPQIKHTPSVPKKRRHREVLVLSVLEVNRVPNKNVSHPCWPSFWPSTTTYIPLPYPYSPTMKIQGYFLWYNTNNIVLYITTQ